MSINAKGNAVLSELNRCFIFKEERNSALFGDGQKLNWSIKLQNYSIDGSAVHLATNGGLLAGLAGDKSDWPT